MNDKEKIELLKAALILKNQVAIMKAMRFLVQSLRVGPFATPMAQKAIDDLETGILESETEAGQ